MTQITPLDKIKWSDTIAKKIDDLVNVQFNLKFQDIPEDTFEAFPTTDSKIFVLQNIEDFFSLPSDTPQKIFNPLVYEACIKKINELEKTRDKTNSPLNKEIDKEIQRIKIEKFDPNVPANLASTYRLQEYLDNIKSYIGYHYYYSTPEKPFFDKNNPTFRACIAILMYLLFKQSKEKTSALSNQEKDVATKLLQEKAKALYLLKDAASKEKQIKEIKFADQHKPEDVKKSLTEKHPLLSFTPLKQPSKTEEEITEEQEQKRKAFQEGPKTFWERFQGWWYGAK